jgi:hypothetical protein
MSPTSYQAAPPRGRGRTLSEAAGRVKRSERLVESRILRGFAAQDDGARPLWMTVRAPYFAASEAEGGDASRAAPETGVVVPFVRLPSG